MKCLFPLLSFSCSVTCINTEIFFSRRGCTLLVKRFKGSKAFFGDSREMAKVFAEGESNIVESFWREKDPRSAFIKPLLYTRQADILG